jgi:hypothetical protein
MTRDENKTFIRKTESLVKPQDVTAISFLGDFNKFLPKKMQQKIMEKGSRKIPYMGFIIDPYCFFLSYKIKDTAAAQAMLPGGYELAKAAVFKDEEKYPMVIVSAFSARTSAFIGTRLEFYIIARNIKTGLLSWIISDYETNTNSHDPKNGFCGYTSDPAIFTTTPYGELLIEFRNRNNTKAFAVTADMTGGRTEELDEDLWVEGNLSVDYGGELKDESSKNFSLIFDPPMMKEAVNISVDKIEIAENTYLSTLIDFESPKSSAVFPYSQHFIIKQDLNRSELADKTELHKQVFTFLDRESFKTMSGNDIKKPLYKGILISSLINLGIILFLLLMVLL